MNQLLQGPEVPTAESVGLVETFDRAASDDWASAVSQAIRELRLRSDGRNVQLGKIDGTPNGAGWVILALLLVKGAESRRVEEAEQRPVLTLVFVDIVGSTRQAQERGDAWWCEALSAYRAAVRNLVTGEGGVEIDHAGDGFFATFEHPTRAVRAARAIRTTVARLDLEVRIGLHTGECERTIDGLEGVAVHIAARVAGKAKAGEILVSRTVKDLVCGSGLQFCPGRRAVLKGLSQSFTLFTLKAS